MYSDRYPSTYFIRIFLPCSACPADKESIDRANGIPYINAKSMSILVCMFSHILPIIRFFQRERTGRYPLTPPSVMPFAKLPCKNGYRIKIGRIPTTAIAIRMDTLGIAARPTSASRILETF